VEDGPVLVYGLGTLGLLTVAALTRLYPRTTVFAVGRHAHQERLARQFGAREILAGSPGEIIARVAELTSAKILRPWGGLPWLQDGVQVTYDTVGSAQTLETAIRITRSRGSIVVSGVEIPRRFEWTPLYFKELVLMGSNAFATESWGGRRVHAMALYLELAEQGFDPTAIITHRFPLARWREGFRTLMTRSSSEAVKVLLTPS
jgi:threonine dehydrogenase-like Zn-dependent dehydrogenase